MIAYARVSTTEQARGDSCERQLAIIQEHAKLHNHMLAPGEQRRLTGPVQLRNRLPSCLFPCAVCLYWKGRQHPLPSSEEREQPLQIAALDGLALLQGQPQDLVIQLISSVKRIPAYSMRGQVSGIVGDSHLTPRP